MKMLLQAGGSEIGVRAQFRIVAFPERKNTHTKLGSDPNFTAPSFQQRPRSESAKA
jgi:hypothetical protein